MYLRGSNFDRCIWYPIREAAGIPETFRFHDLRHTQAFLMLAAGVDLKVIQKRLGQREHVLAPAPECTVRSGREGG